MSTEIWDGEWHHIAGTYDGSNLRLYVDGSEVGSGKSVSKTIGYSAGDLFIGSYGMGYYFDGLIDEVRIWSSALEASQLDDMTPPKTNFIVPNNDETYLLNQLVNANWNVTDENGTGVASAVGSVPSGSLIDTNSVGEKTFTISATDYAKNPVTNWVKYKVLGFSGILPPIKPDGTRVFKLGSTIPVKFQLWDADGNFITDTEAEAKISLKKIIGEDPLGVPEDGDSTSAATIGNLFRYDDTDNQYIFNLATKELSIGTWEITITVNGTGSYSVKIGLR
ncbi:hypothetical protein ES705_51021 [subsurface metagenome]